ncbi:MAG: hypothetical protein ACRCUI_03355, partial [Polymorphobacter sp.]
DFNTICLPCPTARPLAAAFSLLTGTRIVPLVNWRVAAADVAYVTFACQFYDSVNFVTVPAPR